MKSSAMIKILAVSSTIFALTLDSRLYAWTLVDVITGREAAEDSFDPENDILFLPQLGKKDFFESIDDLSIARKKDVRKFINLYLSKGRNYTIKGIERSVMYKEVIDAVFAENPDIPAGIACLPLLESGFNPRAVSRSKAVGLWQFMLNTADPLGLKNTRWVDDRRHIEKSTRAAVRHLRGLYRTFGSWELALAAYNGGGGHVRRSMDKAGTWNFWELLETDTLRTETSEYVPRFIALLIIYKNQELFGLSGLIKAAKPAEAGTVLITYSVPLSAVARLSGTHIDTVRSLNPDLIAEATPPEHDYTIILPLEQAKQLEENIDELYKYRVLPKTAAAKTKNIKNAKNIKNTKSTPNKKSYAKQYKVKKGDTISSIAKKNNRTASEIMQLNKIANINRIIPGKIILIPN
ncbi:MAG: transglycosylase SLT domain-containing protein [Spirochaetia bacterium]|jgi:membrane-bound lytic murein transglycosylase D|nr:transglycosylase SLT domain-containing protein [Spirochaetia bacterium]